MDFKIQHMISSDVDSLAAAFASWNKPREQYERYWRENQAGQRITIIAMCGEAIAGYSNLVWQSDYAPFREAGIPEINDMNVIEPFRRRGIATAFIHEAERLAAAHGKALMGIGFGLTADYGNAQRLYPKLGYIPDGRGAQSTLWSDVLYLTRPLS